MRGIFLLVVMTCVLQARWTILLEQLVYAEGERTAEITSNDDNRRHVVVEYEHEFPFDLTCPYINIEDSKKHRSVTIALAYHVGMLNNWKNVVLDQLQTLHQCGLGHVAQHLLLSYTGGEDEKTTALGEILDLMEPYDFSFQLVRVVQPQVAPFEGAIMNAVHKYCVENRNAVVFYAHNKGVSKYNPNWRNLTHGHSYSRVLYWRKFMEYFTLQRPQLCLDAFASNKKSACGVNLKTEPWPHFSGNFWAATCDYLSTLQPINLTHSSYTAAEEWIGGQYNESRFINLCREDRDLYYDLVQPSEYCTNFSTNVGPNDLIGSIDDKIH